MERFKKTAKRILFAIIIVAAIYLGFFWYVVETMRANGNTIEIGDYKVMAFNFDEGTIVRYMGNKNDVKIPRRILWWKITKIHDRTFEGNDEIETLFVPNSVTEVGMEAFYKCSSLKEVYFEDGGKATEIGTRAFMNCEKLEDVHLPEGLVEIGGASFADCMSLYDITIPSTVERIEGSAFFQCHNLGEVQINGEPSVNYVESDAFEQTKWLRKCGDYAMVGRVLYAYKGTDDPVNIPEGTVGGNTESIGAKVIVYPASYQFSELELSHVENYITLMFIDEGQHYFDNVKEKKYGYGKITVMATPNSTVWNDASALGINVVEKTE